MLAAAIQSEAVVGRRILLLSFYFEPDIGPGPVRNSALAEKLVERLLPGDKLEVLTTLPNRYASFGGEAPTHEVRGPMTIRRVALPAHQSGMKDQARAFWAYALAVWRQTRGRRYDLVFASSSRLMTAALGCEVARRSNARLYLDIRDIFTETMQEILGGRPARLLLPIFERLERRVIRAADTVNLVSPGFLSYFRSICSHDYRVYTNGIDKAVTTRSFNRTSGGPERVVLYAGNIGEGQGLHRVIPAAAQILQGRVRFRLIGDGGRRRELERAITAAGVDNVEILDPVPRERLWDLYADADVLFVHLNDYCAFQRVLPSKVFEYAATGKPVLAGVAGCAADFMNKEVPGSAVFSPCDVAGLVGALERLSAGSVDRTAFIRKYRRDNIMAAMADDLLRTLNSHGLPATASGSGHSASAVGS